MRKGSRLLFFVVIAVVSVFAAFCAWGNGRLLMRPQPDRWSLTTLEHNLQSGLQIVHWKGTRMTGEYKRADGSIHGFEAQVPEEKTAAGADLERELIKNNVNFAVDPPSMSEALVSMVTLVGVPILILAFIWFLVLRPTQMSGLHVNRPVMVDVGSGVEGFEIRLFIQRDSREGQSLERIMGDLGCGPEETVRRLLRAYPGAASPAPGGGA